MVRQQRVRRRALPDPGGPESEPRLDGLPRRPVADTRQAGRLLERIRRLLVESRTADRQRR
jgi:hypothetical protein